MNDASLVEVFAGDGLLQSAGSNQPFWLDEPASVWLVHRGAVDVFIVPQVGDGPGLRTHFFRAGPGQIIFGLAQDERGPALRFQAVGSNETELYLLPL